MPIAKSGVTIGTVAMVLILVELVLISPSTLEEQMAKAKPAEAKLVGATFVRLTVTVCPLVIGPMANHSLKVSVLLYNPIKRGSLLFP